MGGASSKATFSSLMQTLVEKNVDANDHEFWDELWRTVLPAEEMFEIITPDDIRRLIAEKPDNIRIVFTQAVAQLYQVVETPYPIYFQQALNCARMLTRLMPFLLESNSPKVKEMLWNKRLVKNAQETKESEQKERDMQESEPLAVILVNTLFHLLFLPDFTIPDPSVEFSENDIDTPAFKNALMWAPGVGSNEKTITNSTQFDANRIDILRLMIATFCDPLYQRADHYDPCQSMFLEVATSNDAPYAEIVFNSLLNIVLSYDAIGWGLPYSNLVTNDTAKTVMEYAVQVLIILLDYGYPIAWQPNNNTANPSELPFVNPNDYNSQGFNIFRKLLGNINAPDAFHFMYNSFVRLLNNILLSDNSLLPFSITKIEIESELLILFWKLLEENSKFMHFILKNCDITEILIPILYFLLINKKEISKIGEIYLLTFILLKLSGERNFAISLNKPYLGVTLPELPLFNGTFCDALILTLQKIIISQNDKINSLFSCFLTIIVNISPYCKSLCNITSNKLCNLFKLFLNNKFLLKNETNFLYLNFLLEIFNNLIQYQFEGNSSIILSILRKKNLFENLEKLTFENLLNKNFNFEKNYSENLSEKTDKSVPNMKNLDTIKDNNIKNEEKEKIELNSDLKATDLISMNKINRDNLSEETSEQVTLDKNNNNHNQSNLVNPTNNGQFIPTKEWFNKIKSELNLIVIIKLIKNLLPQINEFIIKSEGNSSVDEKQIIDYIKSITMVGLLPVPHPIIIRKYQPNKFTNLWFSAFLWGIIFMHNQMTAQILDGKHVRLFIVQTI